MRKDWPVKGQTIVFRGLPGCEADVSPGFFESVDMPARWHGYE